ncbi:hypothetical protein J1614_009483 [Plenodomus biglobosus]|nr:hypothetical protein J1614_009483 [Plenodomus biglobosus]
MSAFGFPPVLIGIPLDCIKQEVLSRLRWSILGSVEDIYIETELYQDGTDERRPFLSHPVAMESLTVPPVNRIQISSEDISGAMHFHLAPEDYQYEPQTIENADGSPITIKDFVVQVHNHLNQHRDVIFNYRKMVGFNRRSASPRASVDPGSPVSYYTEGKHDLFFKHASSSASSEPLMVNISTFLTGEMGKSAEAFWESQRAAAAATASRRENMPGFQSSE